MPNGLKDHQVAELVNSIYSLVLILLIEADAKIPGSLRVKVSTYINNVLEAKGLKLDSPVHNQSRSNITTDG